MAEFEDFILSEMHDFQIENIEEIKYYKWRANTSIGDARNYYTEYADACKLIQQKLRRVSRKMHQRYWYHKSLELVEHDFVLFVDWLDKERQTGTEVYPYKGHTDAFTTFYNFFYFLLRVYQVNAQRQAE